MDRLKSVVTRAKSLRVPNLSSDDDRYGTTLPERPRSASLMALLRSSSSSRRQNRDERPGVNQILEHHVRDTADNEFKPKWGPTFAKDLDSDQRNMIYVTSTSPIEKDPDLTEATSRNRRRAIQPERAPQYQLDDEEMFSYEDANPCPKCEGLTVEMILKGKKTFQQFLGSKHHESATALQDAGDKGCKLCRMIAKALVLENSIGNSHLIEKLSTAAVYLSPSPESQNFYGPLTVEICTPFGDIATEAQVISACRLGFYTDRRASAANLIPGRRLSRKADLETICYEIKRWMKHDMEDKNPITVLPKRLLDVRHNIVRLRQADDYPDEREGQYICLSHRWSTASQLMTTTLTTLEERVQGIKFDDLTQTFQDAIAITRKLGISYIWIDSLCIIQDSQEDWEEESSKMGIYYGSSWLTIGAGMDGDGLFLERLTPPEPYIKLRMPTTENGKENSNIYFSITPHDMPLRGINASTQSPLYSRGWTLQEEMLSPRFLSFEPTQVYYRGAVDIEYESGYRSRVNKWKGFGQQHLNSRDLWLRIVEDFSTRTLSVASDKLPAVSGLAHEYQSIWKDTYLAGLWHSELWKHLLWYSDFPQRLKGYRAPTWSWASIDGAINFAGTRFSKSCINVIGALIEPKGKNALGQVKGGILTIQATVLELEMQRWDDSEIESNAMGTTYLVHKGVAYKLLADEEVPAGVKVFFMYISETMGLALLPMASARSTFRRIGLCPNMYAIDQAVPKSIICIV